MEAGGYGTATAISCKRLSIYPDVDRVAKIISDVAAEIIVPRFRGLLCADVHTKEGPHDVVTIVDTEAENALAARLKPLVPESRVLGEESCSSDPSLLPRLAEKGRCWLIDPLDGTLNFVNSLPLFGVMVAYIVDGETVGAWIHDPINGQTAMGIKGGGVRLNGQTPQLKCPADPKALHGTVSVRDGDPEMLARIASRLSRIGSVFLYRCAALEYMAILSGASHFSLYHRVMPWDHAAGTFLVQEAGGVAKWNDGAPYRPAEPTHARPLLTSVDPQCWDTVHAALIA